MPAIMNRKILRCGDSKVVALPTDWLKAFKLTLGEQLEVLYDSIVIVKPRQMKLERGFLTKEFAALTEVED